MPRRTRLNAEIETMLVKYVATGVPLEVAAQACGIPAGTFWEWMARGEGRDGSRPSTPQFAAFAEKVRRAEAEAHVLVMGTVRTAAVQRQSWEAARAMLKMRWPRYYAERTEISGPDGGGVPLEISGVLEGMTDADLDRLLRRLRAAGAAGGGTDPEEESPGVRLDEGEPT